MKQNFKVENYHGYARVSLNHKNGGIRQLAYGDVYRGLDSIKGYYDNSNENLWPKEDPWERKYIDMFMEYCENGCFMGVYLLWFVAHLPIVKPKIIIDSSDTSAYLKGKPKVFFVWENLGIGDNGYSIDINTMNTECGDVDQIILEVSKALESFNIENVFNEIVQHYKNFHFKTFGANPDNVKKEEDESAFHPCWKNKIEPFRKLWSYKQALDVFINEFEKHKIYFYEQLA